MTEAQKIDQMYAFIAEDQDGNEGVMAFRTPVGDWMPMVGANLARVKSLRPIAEETGVPFKIAVFTNRKVIEMVSP